MLEVENAVVVVVLVFLKHNVLRGILTDSSYFYTDKSIWCTNFRVRVTPFARTLRARSSPSMQFVKACKT